MSPTMAAEVGATIAEIGHCERRALFGETDEIVRAKTEAALAANITPLICVGDTKLENGAGAADGDNHTASEDRAVRTTR